MPSYEGWAKAPDYRDQPWLRSALEAATAADRARYMESGFTPVDCGSCANRVLVKKNSQEHTSIQWTSDAATTCPEFAARAGPGGSTAHVESCPKLRASIERAVREGVVEAPGRDG